MCVKQPPHAPPCPFDAGKECSTFQTKGTLFCLWAMWKLEKVEARRNLFCQGGKAVCSYLHCTLQLLNKVAGVPAMIEPQLSFASCPAVLPASSWLFPPSIATGWYEVVWIWWFLSEIPLRFFSLARHYVLFQRSFRGMMRETVSCLCVCDGRNSHFYCTWGIGGFCSFFLQHFLGNVYHIWSQPTVLFSENLRESPQLYFHVWVCVFIHTHMYVKNILLNSGTIRIFHYLPLI